MDRFIYLLVHIVYGV